MCPVDLKSGEKHNKRTDVASKPFHFSRSLRVVAKAVGRLRDHQLAESGNNYEDKDGHQLEKQSQTSLFGERGRCNPIS